jgi:hypothetical protein
MAKGVDGVESHPLTSGDITQEHAKSSMKEFNNHAVY